MRPAIVSRLEKGEDPIAFRQQLAEDRALTPLQLRAALAEVETQIPITKKKALLMKVKEAENRQKASERNHQAWDLVDPDRTNKETDVEKGLILAGEAVQLSPNNSDHLDTLAWALYENGDFDTAIETSKLALQHAAENLKTQFQTQIDRLQKQIEEKRIEEPKVSEELQEQTQ